MDILPENSSAKDLFFRVMRGGSVEDVWTLVRHGANINWREDTGDGFTGLLVAVDRRKKKLLEFLLSKGADANLADKHGVTPLMFACGLGLPAMVEKLCQAPGINLNTGENEGYTALMIAVSGNKPQCVEKFRAIAGAGIDWNAGKDGYSAVMFAVAMGHVGVVEALLPISNLDLSLTGNNGCSVAHIAVKSDKENSLRILQLLCQDGRVNWNVNTGPGNPLLMALERNKVEMFRTLVRTPGVNTDITDPQGRSLAQLVM